MKASKIDRVVSGLTAERAYLARHASLLKVAGTATDVLDKRMAVVDELLDMLTEPEATADATAAPKRTRKRKAGLPEAEK